MWIIKSSTIKMYYSRHRDTEPLLREWIENTKEAVWNSLADVRKTYRTADSTEVNSGSTVTIFNVKGNRYRLIVSIHYNSHRVYVRDFMTHEEYNSQRWKKRH